MASDITNVVSAGVMARRLATEIVHLFIAEPLDQDNTRKSDLALSGFAMLLSFKGDRGGFRFRSSKKGDIRYRCSRSWKKFLIYFLSVL